jgi:hypothetical protein
LDYLAVAESFSLLGVFFMAREIKPYLCKECGETDSKKFGRGQKSNCIKCSNLKKKARLGTPDRGSQKHLCRVCETTDISKFRTRNKGICRKCQDSQRYKNNREIIIRKNSDYVINKLSTDTNFRLLHNLRRRQRFVLKGEVSTTQGLGCTSDFLRHYLESLWEPFMSWDNYGIKKGQWSLDHIFPLSGFEEDSNGNWDTDSEYNKLLIHFTNLQPLWHEDNLEKYNKVL